MVSGNDMVQWVEERTGGLQSSVTVAEFAKNYFDKRLSNPRYGRWILQRSGRDFVDTVAVAC